MPFKAKPAPKPPNPPKPPKPPKVAEPVIQYEALRRALLTFAVDCDRLAVYHHGTSDADELRADARAARARAKELETP